MSVATVIAMSPTHTFESAVQSTVTSNPAASAMRVYLDPQTGEVSSTPNDDATFELDAATAQTLDHNPANLVTERHTDGSESISLDGTYGDVLVVRVGPQGQQQFCTTDAKSLVKGMTDTTTPTGPEVK
jgi:hypothetical protein